MRTRVREAVFSILEGAARVRGGEVLDLFAGSGTLGLEALSRGALRCTFVERDRNVARLLRENLAACGLSRDEARVVVAGVEAFAPQAERPPTLVLADPPFDLARPLPGWLADPAATAPGAWLVVEQPTLRGEAAIRPEGWHIVEARTFGGSRVFVLERGEAWPRGETRSGAGRGGAGPSARR